MKTDVINGYRHLIFEQSEIAQAREAAKAGSSVLVAVPCVDCKCGPIRAILSDIDSGQPIRHSDSFHSSIDDEEWR